ncbi:MAG: hypothetical protein KIT36_07535 [Alphaproteobacteria bacterium]|nr:hypothetical protein [Alphaproteobacteria bacterium]
MWALTVAAIYLVPFVVIGWAAKRVIDRYMHGSHLSDVHDLAGDKRRSRKMFLLGSWRDEP